MESPDIASFPVPPDSTLVPHPRPALALDCSRAVLCPCRFIVGPGDEGHLVRKVILKHSDGGNGVALLMPVWKGQQYLTLSTEVSQQEGLGSRAGEGHTEH